MNTIITTQLRHLAPRQEEQFRAIYFDSFPPEERADFSSVLTSIAAGDRWFFAVTQEDDLIGFATIVPYVAVDIHLLEYFAVAYAARGGGIGGTVLDNIVAFIRSTKNVQGIMLEVETDEEGSDAERQLCKRRIGFYQRHGARIVEAVPQYRVPCAHGAGTMPMKLMWLPVDGKTNAPRGAKLRECLVGIYVKSYGLKEDDLLIEQTLTGIG